VALGLHLRSEVSIGRAAFWALIALLATDRAHARPLGAPGTSRAPETSPIDALEARRGPWTFSFHENLFLSAGRIPNGESPSWLMFAAGYRGLGAELSTRTVLQIVPLSVLELREERHELFTELAISHRLELAEGVALQLYGGPAGEPALGPQAYTHRASAIGDPFAPRIRDHFDATRVSHGVVTAGVSIPAMSIEGSWFNGRARDGDPYDLDLRTPDSCSARVTYLPLATLSLQTSYGYLGEAKLHRVTTSVSHAIPLLRGSSSAMLAWSRNLRAGEPASDALLVESNFALDEHHAVFGRVELGRQPSVWSAGGGYAFAFAPLGSFVPSAGARTSVGFADGGLETATVVFFALRPRRLPMEPVM
jgi:hypothetical protein